MVLINQNRKFQMGEVVDPRVRASVIEAMLAMPEIARITYLRPEVVGPRQLSLVADVDLTGDDKESQLAVRLRDLEAKLTETPALVGAVLSLSAPDEPSLG